MPPNDAARIRAAFHGYLSVEKGVTHSKVVSLLGNESRRDGDGASSWGARYDSLDYACIRMRFDSGNRVRDIKLARGWGVQGSGVKAKFPFEHEG
jgi:hypothetical protein